MNERLLRVALFVVAGCMLAYGVEGIATTMLSRHVLDDGGASSRVLYRLPVFIDAFIEFVMVGALGAAAAAVWSAGGAPRVLFLVAAAAQLINTGADIAYVFDDSKRPPGIDWGRFLLFALTTTGGRVALAFGIHGGVRASGRDTPASIPVVTTAFLVFGQITSVLRLTVLTEPQTPAPNLLWYQGYTIGFGMVTAAALCGAFALSTRAGGDVWAVASKGFASLRSLAITRVVIGIGFGALVRFCLYTKSFGGAYWLTMMLQTVSMGLAMWGLAAVTAASTIPRARVVAFLSAGFFLASTTMDETSNRRLGDFLNDARRGSMGSGTFLLDGLPSLALGVGLLQLVATALLFKTLAEAAYERGLGEVRSDAHRGMGLSIAASLLGTLLLAGMVGAKPWFGALVILPLALIVLVLAVMSFTAFLRATQQLSISLPRN